MNSQERDALNLFLQQMEQAPVAQKEAEADALIKNALVRQPDAGYLLVQRAMQLDYLLHQSQAKLAEVQAELDRVKNPVSQPAASTSFLGNIHAWGRAPAAAALAASPNQPLRAAAPPPPASQANAAAAAPAATTPWAGSMLGTVATTAAGVVAGSFLFQGIQNMMGHHSPTGGFGSNAGTSGGTPSTYSETTVNNYYSNEQPADLGVSGETTAYADASDGYDSDGDFMSGDGDTA